MVRTGLWVLGALALVNGAAAFLLPEFWYSAVPGVTGTGPLNVHFVRDIGAAFLAAGAGLAATAWRPALWPAGAAGAAFLVLHALIHVGEAAMARDLLHAARDAAFIILPAFLAAWLSFAARRIA